MAWAKGTSPARKTACRIKIGPTISNTTTVPITATPTETYRPGQTAFYLICGGGFTRSFRENIFVEASADFYLTPYEYRIYEFDRSSVLTEDVRFTHFVFTIGASYAF